MSISKQSPQDYKHRKPLIPGVKLVCTVCGGNVYLHPTQNVRACIKCGGLEIEQMGELQAADFRADRLAGEIVQAVTQ